MISKAAGQKDNEWRHHGPVRSHTTHIESQSALKLHVAVRLALGPTNCLVYRYTLLALAFFPAAISGYWAYVRLLSIFVLSAKAAVTLCSLILIWSTCLSPGLCVGDQWRLFPSHLLRLSRRAYMVRCAVVIDQHLWLALP